MDCEGETMSQEDLSKMSAEALLNAYLADVADNHEDAEQLAMRVELLRRMEEDSRMREALQKLVDWDKTHPKSYIMNYGGLIESEKELDAICADAKSLLSSSQAVEKDPKPA